MWWDDRRMTGTEAEAFAKKLEATGRYHCVVFPLAGDLALLHVVERSGQPGGDVWPEAFLFRTAAECEALLARAGQPDGARQLPLWDAAGD